MKNKSYILSTLLLSAFLLFACSKDKEDNSINNTYHVIGDEIVHKIYHNMYEPVLIIDASLQNTSFAADSIDLDNDGFEDLLFESRFFTNNSFGASAQVIILHDNLQIIWEWEIDTLFLCTYENVDTVFNWYYNSNPGSCNANSELQIRTWQGDEISALAQGDTIIYSEFQDYETSTRGIGSSLCSFDSTTAYLAESQTNYNYQFTYRHLGIWSGIGERYMAFRIVEDSSQKFGYIRMEIEKYRTIKIYEIVCYTLE